MCACVYVFVCVFLLSKSKVSNDCPTVQSIKQADYLRRHDICDVMFRQRANDRYGCTRGPIWIARGPIWVHVAIASRAISVRVMKQIVTIYTKMCDKGISR